MTPEHVYVYISWDDRSDSILAVCLSLDSAQREHDQTAYGTGRYDRKRPAKLEWRESPANSGHWEPSDYADDGHGYYIERHPVTPDPPPEASAD